jgi:alanine dehydrogenase
MRVGIPTETKNNEFRVAITAAGVTELIRRGHHVVIQAGAGKGSSICDADFKAAGAEIVTGAERVWAEAELLLKVKEPIEAEYRLLRRGQVLLPTCIWRRRRHAPMHCCARAPRRSPTKPCRPSTVSCRCWPR